MAQACNRDSHTVGKCWTKNKRHPRPSISPEFYSRTSRGWPSNSNQHDDLGAHQNLISNNITQDIFEFPLSLLAVLKVNIADRRSLTNVLGGGTTKRF
jgi:hypothetical protein